MPFSQDAMSGPNYEINVTGGESSLIRPTQRCGPAVLLSFSDLPSTSLGAAFKSNLIKVDSTQKDPSPAEHQSRPSRPQRNVAPPSFFGERRFIVSVLEITDLINKKTIHILLRWLFLFIFPPQIS